MDSMPYSYWNAHPPGLYRDFQIQFFIVSTATHLGR